MPEIISLELSKCKILSQEKKKKSNKSLVQKQPGALTADAVNKPAIKRDCYSRQIVNNGETFIKYYLQLDALYHSVTRLHYHQKEKLDKNRTIQCQESCLICLIIQHVKEAQEKCLCVDNLPQSDIFNTLQNYLLCNMSFSQIFQSNIMSCSKVLNNLLFAYISCHIQ